MDLTTLASLSDQEEGEQPDILSNFAPRLPDSGIPQSSEPPSMIEAFGENPWVVQQREENAKRVEQSNRDYRTVLDSVNNPAAFFKDDEMSRFARTPEEGYRTASIDLALRMLSGGAPVPLYGLQRKLAIQDAAYRLYDGEGKDSEEDFYATLKKHGTEMMQADGLSKSLQFAATTSALADPETASIEDFQAWRNNHLNHPAYNRDRDADYLAAWQKATGNTREQIQEFAPQLRSVIAAFKADDGGEAASHLTADPVGSLVYQGVAGAMGVWHASEVARDAFLALPEDQREPFMKALGTYSQLMPAEVQKDFYPNLIRAGALAASQMGAGLEKSLRDPAIWLEDWRIGTPEEQEAYNHPEKYSGWITRTILERQQKIAREARASRAELQNRADLAEFVRGVQKIQSGVYQPIRTDPDSILPESFQRAAYAAPGVLAMGGVASIPYIGPPALYGIVRGEASEDYYDKLVANNVDKATARQKADTLASWEAIPDTLLQLAGSKVIKGLPFVGSLEGKLVAAAGGSEAGRFATRLGIGAVEEASAATLQSWTNPIVQSIAAATDRQIPGVKWTGQGGVFDATWAHLPETFMLLAPAMISGASVGAANDAGRARVFENTPQEHLVAMGGSDESIQQILDARGKGAPAMNVAIDRFMTTLDPHTERATAAAEVVQKRAEEAQQAVQKLQASGELPVVVRNVEDGSWSVIPAKGKGEPLKAPDRDTALRLAQEHFESVRNLEADQIASLQTVMEGFDEAAKLPGAESRRYEFPLGKILTAALLHDDPIRRARYVEQVRDRELVTGGDGSFADQILGEYIHDNGDGTRRQIVRLYDGASVLQIFHEDWHRLRREARERGSLTREDDIAFVRAYDNVLRSKGIRTGKEGRTRLGLLPEGIKDADLTPAMLDEAIAEIGEAEVLKNRKSGRDRQDLPSGAMQLPSGFITRNLTAIARLAPEATQKFSAFLEAVRARFGITMGRAVALRAAERAGHFDTATRDAYLSKLLGGEGSAESAGSSRPEGYVSEGNAFSIGRGNSKPRASKADEARRDRELLPRHREEFNKITRLIQAEVKKLAGASGRKASSWAGKTVLPWIKKYQNFTSRQIETERLFLKQEQKRLDGKQNGKKSSASVLEERMRALNSVGGFDQLSAKDRSSGLSWAYGILASGPGKAAGVKKVNPAKLAPYGGSGGGHHTPAKTSFSGDAIYDHKAAPAVPNHEMQRLDVSHARITGEQSKLYKEFSKKNKKLTWDDMARIETQALINGGMHFEMAKSTVDTSIRMLKKAGVKGATRIPWGGK